MANIQVHLDEWQQEALSELARSRGIAVEAMAKTLLNERLIERIHCAFDDLLSGEPILLAEPLRREDLRREDVRRDDLPCVDTIEQRLKRLFAD